VYLKFSTSRQAAVSSIQVFGLKYDDRRFSFSTVSIYFKNIGDVWDQTSGF
jgi:hypothetical protein